MPETKGEIAYRLMQPYRDREPGLSARGAARKAVDAQEHLPYWNEPGKDPVPAMTQAYSTFMKAQGGGTAPASSKGRKRSAPRPQQQVMNDPIMILSTEEFTQELAAAFDHRKQAAQSLTEANKDVEKLLAKMARGFKAREEALNEREQQVQAQKAEVEEIRSLLERFSR